MQRTRRDPAETQRHLFQCCIINASVETANSSSHIEPNLLSVLICRYSMHSWLVGDTEVNTRDFISQFTWENLRVPQEELEEVQDPDKWLEMISWGEVCSRQKTNHQQEWDSSYSQCALLQSSCVKWFKSKQLQFYKIWSNPLRKWINVL